MIRSKIAMGFVWAFLAFALHVWPGVVAPAHAQGSRKDDIVFNSRGIPLAGATVRVCAMPATGQPCTPLALIYSDAGLTQALANPTTTDGLGNYSFYAAPGKYEIEISGPGITTKQLPNVILPNDPSSPSFSAVSAFSLSLSGNLTVNGNTSVIGNLASGTLNLTNQSTPPGAAGAGTVNLYTKTADRLLYYKDETGTETGPLGPGAQTNVANNWTAQQNFNANQRFKGPNPYVDITAFGARTVNPNSTPAAVGLTANCTATQNQVTISSASTFQNGDGVVLYGCGAPQSMATPTAPTVAPALAMAGTGTGIVSTNAPAGSTTYNYKIVARDKNGGLTAASTTGSTTTGEASLGAQTVNITSMSRSNDVVTVTTASAHGFNVGCGFANCGEVFIGGGNSESDPSFRGWYLVSSAADTTHFTFSSGLDTRNGASTSATGGTATYYNCNHLTWTAVTGAWLYYIYSDRANPGTYSLIGVSRPQGAFNTDFTWEDFGSPMMDNFSFPPYVPTSPPSSATSDHLSTTISSGAGTTTLTLANAAGTTVTGATIRLDAAPGILAAATAINSGGAHAGTLMIPADNSGNQFVVNSYLNLSSLSVVVSQAGPLYLNETFETKARWYGDRSPQYGNQSGAGVWQGNPIITVATAYPGIYNPMEFGTVLQGVALSGNVSNGALLALYEGGFNMSFIGDSFGTSVSSNDYMGVGLYLRGNSGQSATNVIIDRTLFSGGTLSDGASHTPLWYCNVCGQGLVRSAYYLHRGAVLNIVASGGPWNFDHSYINGGSTPLYTFTGGSSNWAAIFRQISLDTFAHPCLASFSQGIVSFPQEVCSPSSGVPPLTGFRTPVLGATSLSAFSNPAIQNRDSMGPICQNGAVDGIFGPLAPWYCINANNAALATGANYPIFVNGVAPAKPTCTVSTGGSLPVGTYAFTIVPVWQNSGEGSYAPTSAPCTTTTGNQTITISYSGTPGNPKGLNLYYCMANSAGCTTGFAVSNTFSNPQPAGSSQLVWTSNSFNASASPGSSVPSGGPTMLMPGTQGIATPALTLAGSSINPPPSGFTATRNISFPDSSGIIPVTGYQNSAYDNATRANGAIGSNWTVTNNGINVSSNNFVGTVSNAGDIAYWAVNAFSPAQFSQVTLTALNGTTDFPGTAVLLSGSGGATHGYNCVEDTTNIFIEKITGTTNTTLTSAGTTGAAADILRLEVDGSGNLNCYKNGVSTLTTNDTTYTSGSPGLFLFGTVASSKNWSGGNLHPLSHLDTEQDWTKTQHFTQGIALGGAASESLNNNPRAEQNVFLPGALTSTWTGSTWTTDRPVTITRVQVQAKTAPSGCTTNAVVRLTDGTTPVNVTISAAANDSGAISQNYAAGALLTVAVQTAAAGCATSPADANVTVQYRMQ